MKKIVVLLLLLLVTVGAFALDKTVGGGLLFNAGFTNGKLEGEDNFTITRNGFGAFGFFGVSQFMELNLGFLYKNPRKIKADGMEWDVSDVMSGAAALQLGIYGKYPIPISDTLVFFPTGGVDFELTLGGKAEKDTGYDWWHDLWLRGGLGLDVFFTDRMFLRSHLIYGAAIPMGGSGDLGLTFGHGFLMKVGIGFML
jgi:hypothetical protein